MPFYFNIKQFVLFTWIDTNYSTQHPIPNLLSLDYEYGVAFALVVKRV